MAKQIFVPLFLLVATSCTVNAQILVDSIPLPNISQGFWGIHVTPDTVFLGADASGDVFFYDHSGTMLGQQTTNDNFNHGLVVRPNDYLIAEDFATGGATLYRRGHNGTLLGAWPFPPANGGNTGGIGDLHPDGNAVWYTVYHPDFSTYPFAYAYKWIPGDPTPIDTVPLQGDQPYGVALKGDTLLYVTDNLGGDLERIHAYDLTNEQDIGWVDLPDTPIDNDMSPRGMYYDGTHLYLVARRPGPAAFAYQTILIYEFDMSVGFNPIEAPAALSIVPSLANSEISVLTSSNEDQLLEAFDLTGKKVFSEQFNSSRLNISTADWPEGLYLVHLVQDGEVIGTGKVVVQH